MVDQGSDDAKEVMAEFGIALARKLEPVHVIGKVERGTQIYQFRRVCDDQCLGQVQAAWAPMALTIAEMHVLGATKSDIMAVKKALKPYQAE